MRIALLVPEYRTPQATEGGVTSVADFLLTAFASEAGWDVEIVSPRMWVKAPESRRLLSPGSWLRHPRTSHASARGVAITYVGADFPEIEQQRFRPRSVMDQILRSFDAVVVVSGTPAICEIVRRVERPILSQVATTVEVERSALMMSGGPFGRLRSGINRRLTSLLDRRGVKAPDIVVVENSWMHDWCSRHEAKRVVLQAPGIDTSLFSPRPQTAGSGYVLTVGRLADPRKDLATLIRAYAASVARFGIEQDLILAGSEPPPDFVLGLIAELGLTHRVEVRVGLSTDELVRLYQGADLFVLSSTEEGLGLVLIEAMSCGIPVVATQTVGAQTVVDHGVTGLLVPFGENVIDGMAESIASYANDLEARAFAGEAARGRVVSSFSSESAGQRFTDLLRETISDYRAKRSGGSDA